MYAPAALALVYRLVTKHRNSLLNDAAVAKLNAEALRVAPKLDRTFEAAVLDMVGLIADKGIEDVAMDLRSELKFELNLLLEIIGNLQGKGVSLGSVPAAALLEAGKGLMAQHRWRMRRNISTSTRNPSTTGRCIGPGVRRTRTSATASRPT